MPLIKKFCYCFSLRSGALTIAYVGLTIDVLDSVATIYTESQYCGDILLLWIISTVWNIISEMVLLTALHRDNPHLLPVHLVTCLCGLILEMTNHMWIASLGITDYILMSYAFFLIACKCSCGRRGSAQLLPIGNLVDHSDYPLTQATDRAQHAAFCGARLGAKIYLENVAQSGRA
ncbi:uncharacterized protein LOC120458530 isoform X3 [Drosophila santomea]|uniref:uncharacterized protein LOC120458530 isoform X3 n=1 Tax=Drosophila santomea TaxID=129105 RepID=UPI00195496C6|nr:uncharacterized protein LOC120458530 isoform X3 [Drosophila santomea]